MTERHEVHAAEGEPAAGFPPMPRRWYVLRCRSRTEFQVRDELRHEGIETFLPTWKETVKWSDRQTVTERPLFTGYIFARFAASDRAVFVRGVVEILSLDQKPVSVPDDVVEAIQLAVLSPRPVVCCPYVAGAPVTVSRGPFAGRTGVVIRVKGATTLYIPVELLGRSVPVEINAKDVSNDS